ncbi:hypothetical protein M9Y10_033048, partial [Tritrichomonas musculus]
MYVINHPNLFNEEAKEILDDLKAMYDSSRNGQRVSKREFNDTVVKFRDLDQYLIDPQDKIPDFSSEEIYKFLSTECGASEFEIHNMTDVINYPNLYGDEIKQVVKEVTDAWDRYYYYKSDDAHAK